MFTRTGIAIDLKSYCVSENGAIGKKRNEQISRHRK
jgi:hypothetical protein